MLIPIGFFGAGGAAGSYELISTSILSANANVFTFTSIPSTYSHLQIRGHLKAFSNATVMLVKFNGDSSGSYDTHVLRGNGGTAYSGGETNNTFINLNFAGYEVLKDFFGTAVLIDIPDYSKTTKNKTIRAFTGRGSSDSRQGPDLSLRSGLWRSTAAISTIQVSSGDGSFATGSRLSLYGIKG